MRSRALLLAILTLASMVRAAVYSPPAFDETDRRERLGQILPRLDALYLAHATNHHLPGFVYGVVLDGELIHSLAWGQAGLAPSRPVTTGTRFRIASMTKSFTALAVLRLRDQGRLTLEDPVSKFIPEFRRVRPLTDDSPRVTVRHLLKMTGGFPQDDPWGDRRLADSEAELSRLVSGGLHHSNPPGVQWEYSNLGYALLGQVVTKAARRPFQEYITREILRPLGMRDTVWEFAEVPSRQLALGYRWEHGGWQPEPILHDGTFGAMGGLITTLGDFSRYVAMHLAAWPPRDGKDAGPVSRSTLREMHRPSEVISVIPDDLRTGTGSNPRVAGYSFGLSWNQDARGRIWLRHAGGLPGFGSEYRFLPEYGVGLVAFANRTYAPMTAVNTEAMEIILSEGKLTPRRPRPSPILQHRAGQLARILQEWPADVVADALSPNVFQDQSAVDWREQVAGHLARIGSIRQATPVTPENQLRGRFDLVGERGRLEVFLTLMPEDPPKIQAIRLAVRPE